MGTLFHLSDRAARFEEDKRDKLIFDFPPIHEEPSMEDTATALDLDNPSPSAPSAPEVTGDGPEAPDQKDM